MKLTKYLHSCLLAEDDGQAVLFDPGNFTAGENVLDVDTLERLDVIVITHEHPDHFDLELVKRLAKKFPKACFISTPTVVQQLQDAGVTNGLCASMEPVVSFSTQAHASLKPLSPDAIENVAVHAFDRLTVTGDRHDVTESKEILAYPIVAPWGSLMAGAQMVVDMETRPVYIMPLHDYHWREDQARLLYDRLENFFKDHGITVLKPETGVPIEV